MRSQADADGPQPQETPSGLDGHLEASRLDQRETLVLTRFRTSARCSVSGHLTKTRDVAAMTPALLLLDRISLLPCPAPLLFARFLWLSGVKTQA